jgi:hypothetical protein
MEFMDAQAIVKEGRWISRTGKEFRIFWHRHLEFDVIGVSLDQRCRAGAFAPHHVRAFPTFLLLLTR